MTPQYIPHGPKVVQMSTVQQNAPDSYAFPLELASQTADPSLSIEPFINQLLYPPAAETTCHWVTDGHGCGAILPADPTLVSVHLRNAHGVRGDSKETTTCLWWNCHSRPIQQRNLVRHILSVHLRLLRWTCPQCFRTFARRGIPHNCQFDIEILPQA